MLFGLIFVSASASFFYLGHRNQALFQQALNSRKSVITALLLLLLGFVMVSLGYSLIVTSLLTIGTLMVMFMVLPVLAQLIKRRAEHLMSSSLGVNNKLSLRALQQAGRQW